MTCEACKYDGSEPDGEGGYRRVEWIELVVVERSPFFHGTPDYSPPGSTGLAAVKRGTPIRLFACPQCGTVKIDI